MPALLELLQDPAPLIAALAALSAAAAVLAASWPYIAPDRLAQRLERVENERRRLREKERARLASGPGPDTRLRLGRPRRVYKTIVEKLGLHQKAEDGEIARRLRMAGFRGPSAMITYLAVRVLGALAMFLLTLLYLYGVLGIDQPLVVGVMFAALAGALGYFGPPIYIKNRIDKRQLEISRNWPDALDLMLICIESGMAIESVFRRVAEEIGVQSPVLAEELSLTTAELAYLQDRRAAYEGLAWRTDLEGVRAVVTGLIQAEKYGTPLARSLRVLAQENRDMRMAAAEKKAAALPPKLTVPMIIFFLPVLFAVIATPAVLQILDL